jgi:hypothetical protein
MSVIRAISKAQNATSGAKIVTNRASALPPKADIQTQPRDVRFVPKADIKILGRQVCF